VPQDSSPRVTSGIPEQRSPAVGRHAAPAAPEEHAPPDERALPDETVVLPAFITGKPEPLPERPKPAPPAEPADPDRLPPSERGMLIFVASLLGLGGLAVIVILGLGGFGAPPQSAGAATTAPVASDVPTPTPSPTPSPSVSPAPASPPPTTKRPTPTRVYLGALSGRDPAAYCSALDAGRAAQHSDRSWYCRGSSSHPQPLPFTSTDVCRWRYLDKTAYAVAADIDEPTTWKCYT
jgi:hypothetical protein